MTSRASKAAGILKAARERAGLTRADVARRAAIKTIYLESLAMRGQYVASSSVAHRLVGILRLDAEDARRGPGRGRRTRGEPHGPWLGADTMTTTLHPHPHRLSRYWMYGLSLQAMSTDYRYRRWRPLRVGVRPRRVGGGSNLGRLPSLTPQQSPNPSLSCLRPQKAMWMRVFRRNRNVSLPDDSEGPR